MSALTATEAMAQLVLLAQGLGFTVRFVEWCEDTETPGLLGQFAGVTDHERRKIKVSTRGRSYIDQVAILAHEVEHAAGAAWATNYPDRGLRCGGRMNSYGEAVR